MSSKELALQQLISTLSDIETWQPYELKFFGSSTRAIPFFGEVNASTAQVLISHLLHLSEEDAESPITIWLNTQGGSFTDGLAIYDCIKNISSPVIVYATGICASAGLIILSAADYRMASQSCIFYYHEPIIQDSAINSLKDMNQLRDHYEYSKRKMTNILKERSEINHNLWKKCFEGKTSYYFDSEKALKYNFIDKVSESAKVDFEIESNESEDE